MPVDIPVPESVRAYWELDDAQVHQLLQPTCTAAELQKLPIIVEAILSMQVALDALQDAYDGTEQELRKIRKASIRDICLLSHKKNTEILRYSIIHGFFRTLADKKIAAKLIAKLMKKIGLCLADFRMYGTKLTYLLTDARYRVNLARIKDVKKDFDIIEATRPLVHARTLDPSEMNRIHTAALQAGFRDDPKASSKHKHNVLRSLQRQQREE